MHRVLSVNVSLPEVDADFKDKEWIRGINVHMLAIYFGGRGILEEGEQSSVYPLSQGHQDDCPHLYPVTHI